MSDTYQASGHQVNGTRAQLDAAKRKLSTVRHHNKQMFVVLTELYQVLGALDAPASVIDQTLAAAGGEPLPYGTLLPYGVGPAYPGEYNALNSSDDIKALRTQLAEQEVAMEGFKAQRDAAMALNVPHAVIEYETARQEVSRLSKQRSGLISACTITGAGNIHTFTTRPNCLVAALDEVKELNNPPYESYEYGEVLYDLHGEGKCCDNCYEAYRLKKGALADARQRFGHAKRRLAAMGKTLMRNEQETTP